MASSDFVPYIRAIREGIQPFADGVDSGEVEEALQKITDAVAKAAADTGLGEKIAAMVDEPGEQAKVARAVQILLVAEMALTFDF